ncbi:uncharacterized protein [Amphiura filiformis]|uniref:uncharacterized protein n=1 Tax=Amphiura filiformis TaxID=82378 RepID=UPI003B21B778
MDSTPVTRAKRKLTAPIGKKRQKTSTPSKSRIEHYMSPGNISKVVGSPIQHQQSTLQSINEITDRSSRGDISDFTQMLVDGKNRNNKNKTNKGNAVLKKSGKSTDDETMESSVLHKTSNVNANKRQNMSRSRKSSRKGANLSSTLQNATIDKFLSPECSSSAITTPTRFSRDRDNDSSSENEETKVDPKEKKQTKQTIHQMSAGTSNVSEDEPSTSTGINQSKQNDEATIGRAKGVNRFMASGDVKTHMEDKEFVASQVHILSKPFTMDGGPRQWINTWKARQSASQNDDGEMEDIPEKVIHKTISKLNYAMNSDLGLRLSRQKQRTVLINLDEIRKEEQCGGADDRQRGKGMLKIGASLEEILEHYPSKWPSTDDVEDSGSEDEIEMSERYKDVHARLSALHESLTKKEQEREQLQNMCSQLQEIDENLRSYTDSDFKKELGRTKSLVSQMLKKLNQRRSPRKHTSSEPTTASKEPTSKEVYKYQLSGHEAIVRHLFASSF